MQGLCYDKNTKPGYSSERRVIYYVQLGQNGNKEELFEAVTSEEDFNKASIESDMLAVCMDGDPRIEEESLTEIIAYLL